MDALVTKFIAEAPALALVALELPPLNGSWNTSHHSPEAGQDGISFNLILLQHL